jgi:DNA-binding transcriptional MocR family regulator
VSRRDRKPAITGRTAREIAASVERAVREGSLHPGDRLPPIRDLASRLGTSPATVAAAYRALGDRGVVVGSGRRGTIVTPRPPILAVAEVAVPEGVRDLRIGLPDQALLPDMTKAFARVGTVAAVPSRHGTPNDETLLALARRRFANDGIDASHVAVVGGALDAIERTLHAHLSRGARVAIEDPTYPPFLDILRVMGVEPVPIAVDDDGLVPESLEAALEHTLDALLLTPRAQNPTGATLTPARAQALTLLLSGHDVLVLEDDHAAGVAGSAPASLTGAGERWAIVRSVSKSLGPDLRLAVLAGDAATIGRVEGRQLIGTGWVSTILQRVVAALWADRRVDRQIAAAARAYAERRSALIDALADRGVAARGRSGLNVWIPVREESSTVEALLRAGWAVAPGERFRLRSEPGIRVTTAGLLPHEAPRLADDIAASQHSAATARAY